MRTIKFRAWSRKTKTMYSNSDLAMHPLKEIVDDDIWSFMQFTGLLDKNGKEIYEGDIFRMTNVTKEELDSIENKFIVCFGEFGERWRNSQGMAGIGFYTKSIYVYQTREEVINSLCNAKNDFNREIIGNIYENPDLLK